MKKLILVFFIYSNINLAQEFSIGLSSGIESFSGNNFFAKTYDNHLATKLDLRSVLYKNFGLGGYFSFAKPNIKSTEFIGNSNTARITEFGVVVFYNKTFMQKWAFVPKVSVGRLQLKNNLANYLDRNYYTNALIYNFGSELQYKLATGISANFSLDYSYIDLSEIKASKSLNTSYQSSNQLGASLGVRLWL